MEIAATELRLGLPGSDNSDKPAAIAPARNNKRWLTDSGDEDRSKGTTAGGKIDRDSTPQTKAQVVGWPPIRSYRKNNFQAKKQESDSGGLYVKVSMDGAPYLRKVDLKLYDGYPELLKALENMFSVFTMGEISGKEGGNAADYAMTYEDKDGDWMLVGDVPWEMFISSCKRLRIMKGSEARGPGSTIADTFTQ